MFLPKHGLQMCLVHGTLAQSGAQIIYTFLQHAISFLIIEEKVEHVFLSIEGITMES